LSKKSFRQADSVFTNLKVRKNKLIERERHPSWVSFTISSFPMSSFMSFSTVSVRPGNMPGRASSFFCLRVWFAGKPFSSYLLKLFIFDEY